MNNLFISRGEGSDVMRFFKSMNEDESHNWKKGVFFGFYAYMLITAINYFYYSVMGSALFSPGYIFLSGIAVAFLFEFIFNIKRKRL
ncbi:hypothetical protein SporoS204_09735 [Sporosarcina ureae]|uniref:Uncharacterized protein n=2 Tax=Sporosarcina ureae TaxID=1571 RepID=A0ABN4YQT0_SPOUR|nr:hypothetical protein SporoS204_09735 [Sporosarcina ureae]